MIYKETINQLNILLDKLQFQERRNFFNRVTDTHLNCSIGILETILERESNNKFSAKDLSEIVLITTKMFSILNLNPDTMETINNLQKASLLLKREYLDTNDTNIINH